MWMQMIVGCIARRGPVDSARQGEHWCGQGEDEKEDGEITVEERQQKARDDRAAAVAELKVRSRSHTIRRWPLPMRCGCLLLLEGL